MEIHSREEKRSSLDTVWGGMAMGLIVPFIVFIFYWYARFYPQFGLGDMFSQFDGAVLMKMLSLCASPDLLVFYYFSRRNWNRALKGMILAILLLLLISVIIKL